MARLPVPNLLEQAAAPVLTRLRAHRDQLDYPGRSLLEYLENHVFDPDLKVGTWRAACKIRSVTPVHQVQAVIGTTIGVYLEELRVETAMRLLVLSEGSMPCAEVAVEVGYGRYATFRKVFLRRTGVQPGTYREQVLALGERGGAPRSDLGAQRRLELS
ncbi:MAG: AraC family transcriptional regulator, partial [Thermoanaerobaculia bacterium]|nr:AraC family transcriptional regulator [Thermoanaerobaculia bacterium]